MNSIDLLKSKTPLTVKQVEEGVVQLVLFAVDQEAYAFPIDMVSEIVIMSSITPVPGAPDYVLGLMDLRGEIMPVIDLEKRFELKREIGVAGRHIIVIRSDKTAFGIRVDSVLGIIELKAEDLQGSPQAIKSKISEEVIKSVGIYKNQVFVLLDALKIITTHEKESILNQVKQQSLDVNKIKTVEQ